MKNYLLFLLLALFCSCAKTKTNTVTVTTHDTVITTVTYIPTIVGTWKSITGVSPISFDSSTYEVQTFARIPYIASIDTIYDISQTNLVYYQWAYKISPHNDSLWLVTRGTGTIDIYTRN